MERNLDPARLVKTADGLAKWIEAEFGTAHIVKVAAEVHEFTKEAVDRAARIRRPIWLLRLAAWGLILLAAAGAAQQVYTHQFSQIMRFLDETKGAAIYIGGFLALLISLEVRWKRRRALRAVSELRALAHVVDMHQLAKDQVIAQFREDKKKEKIEAYLHACTALLAVLSKIGQLYVEHFPDPAATNAVNDFEIIATGLSNKIWMKLLSMKRADAPPLPLEGPGMAS